MAARRKAGKVVQVVTDDKTRATAEIRVLQRPLRFYAEVADERYEHGDGEVVAAWALATLRRNTVSTWIPVIEIFMPTTDRVEWYDGSAWSGEGDGIVVGFRRFYVGRTPSAWWELAWGRLGGDAQAVGDAAVMPLVFNEDRNYNSGRKEPVGFDGTLPYHIHEVSERSFYWEENAEERERLKRSAKRGVLLAYDEATWQALVGIANTLRLARTRLNELVERPDILPALVAAPVALLAAPETNRP